MAAPVAPVEILDAIGVPHDADQNTFLAGLVAFRKRYDEAQKGLDEAKGQNMTEAERQSKDMLAEFGGPLKRLDEYLKGVPEQRRIEALDALNIDEEPAVNIKQLGSNRAAMYADFKDLLNEQRVDAATQALRDAYDDVAILAKISGRKPRELKAFSRYERLFRQNPVTKAMYSTGTGLGDEFVPTELSPSVIDIMTTEAVVAPLFGEPIMVPTNPWTVPAIISRMTIYSPPESQGDTSASIPASNAGTAQRSVTCYRFAGRIVMSEEFVEDSVVPALPKFKQQAAIAMAETWDDCLLNGDDSATHQDSDTTSPIDARKRFKGVRKLALANATTKVDLSTFNAANLLSIKEGIGFYGTDPARNVAWVVGAKGENKMLGLSEVLTMEKYGQNATIHTGEIGRLYGAPVVTSGKVREDLNASGVYDGTTKTKSAVHLVSRRTRIICLRREVRVTVIYNPETEQYSLLVSTRMGVLDEYPTALKDAVGYNF